MRGCGRALSSRASVASREICTWTCSLSQRRAIVSIRVDSALLVVAMASVAAMPVRAQSLAQRVRAVGTGTAELHYTARPGTCGDGRESFSFGNGMHFGAWYGRSDGMTNA